MEFTFFSWVHFISPMLLSIINDLFFLDLAFLNKGDFPKIDRRKDPPSVHTSFNIFLLYTLNSSYKVIWWFLADPAWPSWPRSDFPFLFFVWPWANDIDKKTKKELLCFSQQTKWPFLAGLEDCTEFKLYPFIYAYEFDKFTFFILNKLISSLLIKQLSLFG